MFHKNLKFALAATFALATLPALLSADVVVRKDGKSLHGKIISVDDNLLVLEMSDSGVAMKMKFARADVESFERDAVFFAARFNGRIGKDATAEGITQAVASAQKKGATHLLLVMNLSGGSIAEAEKIAHTVATIKDIEVIGYVEQLSGAGAIAGLGCKRLVMANYGSIEGEIFWDDKDSADFAKSAAAVVAATGRPPMIARALADATIAISLASDGTRKTIVEGEPANSRLLRRKGEALRLSANEAIACGIASGVATDLRNVGKILGLSGWRSYNESGVVKSELAPAPTARFDSGVTVSNSPTTPVSTGGNSGSSGGSVKDSNAAEQRYRQALVLIENAHNINMTRIQKQYALDPAGRRSAELSEDRAYTAAKEDARREYDAAR